jgi:DNA gyrase inhibitor GyrI
VQRFWGSIDEELVKEEKTLDERRPILERYKFALIEKGFCEFCVPILWLDAR